jgi:protein dithiol oxidoreductase (disulfide-forming)
MESTMLQRRLMVLALLLIGTPALAQLRWREGVHYSVIPDAAVARVGAPAGKIEVIEVFSYGCTYCNKARGDIARLAAGLPADAVMTYVHASFLPTEAWPMFQRAYYTARKLGIAEATHDAMFRAIWETGEIPLVDIATGTLRRPSPTIEDAAKFYARASKVTAAQFLQVAKSPEIDQAMQDADILVKQWRVPGTPSLVVNGRYMVANDVPYDVQSQITNFLVSLERARQKK